MDEQQAAKLLGQKGGNTTKQLYGSDHYRKIQLKGAETKRKRKLLQSDIDLGIDKRLIK